MQIDVGSHIADLLYEHNSVNIPGLGGFVSRYKAAAADQVQGELYPPSKNLNFNSNLVADDGLLAQHLHEKLGVSLEDAQQAVDGYVNEVKEAIGRREIVVFPRVGRLYKDYEQNLQFLADTANFNLDSYGLPTIHFYPIARTNVRSSSVRPANGQPQAAVGSGAAVAPPKKKRQLDKGLTIIVSIALAVAIVVTYFLFFYKSSGNGENARRLPTSRVNVSPSQVEGQEIAPSPLPEGTEDALDEESYSSEEATAGAEELDTEGATVAPGQRYFVIGIGVFGDEKNVQRLIERIYKAGYEPFTEPKGRLTRVGIQKAYTNESEIQAALKDVQKKFSKDAKVLRK
ncbi:MAG: SPOR domain-containing protein [Phaeodactylibacter sp.]|nr:SPOR domain-containing protein [Phaeodactylibacter sp.]